jgi:hypothetical protein
MNRKFMNDKRADITIAVLVLGVFAVCTLTLISFYYSSFMIRDPSLGLDVMEEMNSQIEKYNSPQQYHEDFVRFETSQTDSQGNRFFVIEKIDDNVKLVQVKYYLP